MFKKYFIKNSSIQSKLIVAFFFLTFIPVLVLSIVFYNLLERSYEEEVSVASFKILDQISGKLDMLVDQTITMSNTFCFDEDVRDILKRSSFENMFQEVQFNNTMKKKFTDYSSNMGLNSSYVAIIGMNGMTFKSWGSDRIDINSIITQEVKDEAIKNDGKLLWISSHENLANDAPHDIVFTCVRLIKDPYVDRTFGLLVISFSENTLSDIYKKISDKNYEFLIVDKNTEVVSSLNKTIIGSKLEYSYVLKATKSSPQYFTSSIKGINTLVLSYPIKKTGWFIIQLTPMENLLENVRVIGMAIVLVSLFCIIAAFLLSYYIARRISTPIRKLAKAMEKAENGDMNVSVSIIRNDEIGELALGFNTMIREIRRLLQKLISEERQKRKAEFEALQAQINPHFLYNTLTSIRCLLTMNKIEAADDTIIALGRLLRKTFGERRELIPIKEEVENLKDYIFVQKIRYGEQFDVSFEIEQEVLECRILPMVLQPLLENAIFHGIDPSNKKGLIKITARLEDDIISITLTDNGIGMTEDKLKSVLNGHKADKLVFNKVGFININQRVKLHFGEDYGLTISSVLGAGTEVNILIPAVREDIIHV